VATLIVSVGTRWDCCGRLHTPATLPIQERAAGTHLTGGWVCPQSSVAVLEKNEISCLRQDLNPRLSSMSLSQYTDYVVPSSRKLLTPLCIMLWINI